MLVFGILYGMILLPVAIVLLIIRPSIAVSVFTFCLPTLVLSLVFAFLGIISLIQRKKAEKCTVHTIGMLLLSNKSRRAGIHHEFVYLTKEGERRGRISGDYVENVQFGVTDVQYDVWYNPDKPAEFIVSPDGTLSSVRRDYAVSGLVGLIISLIMAFILVTVWLLKLS